MDSVTRKGVTKFVTIGKILSIDIYPVVSFFSFKLGFHFKNGFFCGTGSGPNHRTHFLRGYTHDARTQNMFIYIDMTKLVIFSYKVIYIVVYLIILLVF